MSNCVVTVGYISRKSRYHTCYGPRYKIISPLYSISFFLNSSSSSSSGAYYINSLFLTTIEGRFFPNFPDGALWKAYII